MENTRMPKLKISYFDFHGGRGEVARMVLHMGDIEYEDHRFPPSEWAQHKASTPFGAVPVLEVDGASVAQSNGINRYCGKVAGYYPEDALQAAFCDEIMDAVEDIAVPTVATMFIEDPQELKAKREALVAGPLTDALRAIGARLEARGGEYFADSRLTVADLKVYLWLRHIKSGGLDHVPTDLPDHVAPNLSAHFERVRADPKVEAYCSYRGI